jgi:hypothetical protein
MKCFVIMPYGSRESDPGRKQGLDSLYDHFIRPAVESVPVPGSSGKHVVCHRGDKAPGPGESITYIIENLVLSELAIADLTGRNANVFYELGVRHAVSDNTILISESEEDVPFDLRGQRLILYKRNFEGGGRLRTEISKAVPIATNRVVSIVFPAAVQHCCVSLSNRYFWPLAGHIQADHALFSGTIVRWDPARTRTTLPIANISASTGVAAALVNNRHCCHPLVSIWDFTRRHRLPRRRRFQAFLRNHGRRTGHGFSS